MPDLLGHLGEGVVRFGDLGRPCCVVGVKCLLPPLPGSLRGSLLGFECRILSSTKLDPLLAPFFLLVGLGLEAGDDGRDVRR
jgi:hypothetical protein